MSFCQTFGVKVQSRGAVSPSRQAAAVGRGSLLLASLELAQVRHLEAGRELAAEPRRKPALPAARTAAEAGREPLGHAVGRGLVLPVLPAARLRGSPLRCLPFLLFLAAAFAAFLRPPGMPGSPMPPTICRIIFCASKNRVTRLLTSPTLTPEPVAMRARREPLMILGWERPAGSSSG